MLSKYTKSILREVIVEIESHPKAFDKNRVLLVSKKKSTPYGVVGNIPCKVLEVVGLDIESLLKAHPKSWHKDIVDDIASIILFGTIHQGDDLFHPSFWPGKFKNDPVGRIKSFIAFSGDILKEEEKLRE
jgi:hypothetical protein